MASSLGGDLHNATTMETDRGKLCRYRVSESSSKLKEDKKECYERKLRLKVMKESYKIKESYADITSQNPPPPQNSKKRRKKVETFN